MFRLILLSTAVLAALGGYRAAAQAQGEADAPPATQPPAQLGEQSQAQDNWVVVCDPPADGAEKRCTLLQNLAVRSGETQQRLLTVLVQRQPGRDGMMLLLSLPHGLFLPAGAQIQVDEGEPSKIVIQTSDATGSYAATELTPELLEALRRGQVLKVGMMSADQRGITVPVTLIGFSKGYAELTGALR
jgi:invasion protein IalB